MGRSLQFTRVALWFKWRFTKWVFQAFLIRVVRRTPTEIEGDVREFMLQIKNKNNAQPPATCFHLRTEYRHYQAINIKDGIWLHATATALDIFARIDWIVNVQVESMPN